MKSFKKIILISLLALLAPLSVSAADFAVQFEYTPLFSEANFLPGDSVTRWVDVTNGTADSQITGVEAINYSSCSTNCIAGQLNLEITDESSAVLYQDSLAGFFGAGEQSLSEVLAGDTARYYFAITFIPNSGNNYQDQEVGFDFNIGFFGQETIGSADCGNGVCDGDENCSICPSDCGTCGGGGGGNGGGGGGSYFGGDTGLIIFNEGASPVISGQTDITWETNHPATSRVIYSSQYETHNFDLTNPPNYGYVHSTLENPSLVIIHSMNIAGLVPGVTYYYRVVSHGSFAVSTEHNFTVPIVSTEQGSNQPGSGESAFVAFQTPQSTENLENNGQSSGEEFEAGYVLGDNTQDSGGEITQGGDISAEENPPNPFLASLLDLLKNVNLCAVFFIFIVIVAILVLVGLLEKGEGGKNNIRRWILSFTIIIILVILYGLVCPFWRELLITIAILVFIFLIAKYFVSRKNKKHE